MQRRGFSRRTFEKFDTDRNGEIDSDEFGKLGKLVHYQNMYHGIKKNNIFLLSEKHGCHTYRCRNIGKYFSHVKMLII